MKVIRPLNKTHQGKVPTFSCIFRVHLSSVTLVDLLESILAEVLDGT